jgi:hypothetical protein
MWRTACRAQAGADAAGAIVLDVGFGVVADDQDALVAEFAEMGRDVAPALPVVGGHRVAGRRCRVDDCDRTAWRGNAGGPARHDDHAFDTAFDQPVDGLGLGGNIAARIRNENAVAGRGGGEFDRLRELGEKGLAMSGRTRPRTPLRPVRSARPAWLGT